MSITLDYSPEHSVTGSQLLGASGRLGRVEWLAKKIPENNLFLFQDGAFSLLLFTDLLETFVGGQFIATIILGFSFIERTIAGRLYFIGEKDVAKGNSEKLLSAALRKEWFTIDEYSQLNELRRLRNPLVHFRDHMAETRPEVKASLSAQTTIQMLESDARRILEAAIHILRKTSL